MKAESLSRLRKPLRILLSASILLTGLCLMGACLYIYRNGGSRPFSRETVSAVLRVISLPVFLFLGLSVLSSLAVFLLSRTENAKPLSRQIRMSLHRMQERTDLSLCSQELRTEILTLRSERKLYTRTGWIILVFSSILFLTYGLNWRNFHPVHINRSVIRAMFWLVPCCAVPFFYSLFTARRNHASMVKELELLKSAPRESRIVPPRYPGHPRRILILRCALLAAALILLVYGLFTDGGADVLTKAVNICTECIGLG